MTYMLSLFLVTFNIIQKRIKPFSFLLLGFMWVLAGFNYYNADMENYIFIYDAAINNSNLLSIEVGYLFVNRVSQALGFSFETFWKLYFVIGLLLIYRVIYKYSFRPGFALSLYFIYPFIIDVTQIRNFMVMAILINAIPLLANPTKTNIIKYIVLCSVASTFHYASIFSFLFLLAPFLSKERLFKVVTRLVIVLSIFYTLAPQIILNFLPFLEARFHRHTQSFVSINTRIGMIVYLFVGLYLVYIAFKRYGNLTYQTEFMKQNYNLAEIVLKVNIIVLLLYPLLLFAFEFIRVYRNILVLNYIVFSNVLFIRRSKMLKDISFWIGIIVFALASCWYFIYFQFPESVFFPLFENNRLFQ